MWGEAPVGAQILSLRAPNSNGRGIYGVFRFDEGGCVWGGSMSVVDFLGQNSNPRCFGLVSALTAVNCRRWLRMGWSDVVLERRKLVIWNCV